MNMYLVPVKRFGLFLGLSLLIFSRSQLDAGQLGALQEQWLSKAYRFERAGWTYVHVEGDPRALGFQHGYLLAPEIAESKRVMVEMWRHQTGMEWAWLVEQTKRFMSPALGQEIREEIDGLVEGMNAAGVSTTRDEIITQNAYFELSSYWWPERLKRDDVGQSELPRPRDSCSSFIATGSATSDGMIVLGHNTMIDYAFPFFNVILDLAPSKGHHILMQTLPGWIHSGSDFFITDGGLVGSETTIGDFHGYSEKGIAEFARMRRATQFAGNLEEWCAIMKEGNNGGYANSWLIGDAKTGEIARLELGLKFVGMEKKNDGYFIGSNIAEDLRILRQETNSRDSDIRVSSVARRVRWNELMKKYAGRIDLDCAKAMEGDDYDVYTHGLNPSSRTLAGHYELDGDPRVAGWDTPFTPAGSVDSKVVDSRMAKQMTIAVRWGSADGMSFDANAFLNANPQYSWQAGLMRSRPSEPWVEFRANEKP